MGVDTALEMIGGYVLIISALALAVERVMDVAKAFASKYLGGIQDDGAKRKDDPARERRVRVGALVVAIPLSLVAKVDTFELLGMDSPHWLGYPILGWLLSGLVASRGSAFWHDVVAMVNEVKKAKRQPVPSGT
ncbi:MAG: hypothetical protein KAW46_01480 [candidate division Zixibacteria bacterium]|nr:hypothetical protein [candidate division Zixibacteria bacterium]